MINVNYVYDDGHIASIRHSLQVIQGALFYRDGSSRNHLEETPLYEAIAHLEKENERLPLHFRKQIDFVLSEVRYILSNK